MQRIPLHEFGIIETYLKPLAKKSPYALQLRDDAAVIPFIPGKEMILSTDTSVANIHFLLSAPANLIAKRCLRSSLSDLAAMGATPLGYLMNLALTKDITSVWLEDFCQGLQADQDLFNVHLLGGDITHTNHELSVTITVTGFCEQGKEYKRSTAVIGDQIYVTGTIGDAYLGLRVLQGHFPWLTENHKRYLIDRYMTPMPRLHAALRQCPLITAAIDISDGLMQDLQHICRESALSAHIMQDKIPFSLAAREILAREPHLLGNLIAGGDDYELLLAVASGTDNEMRKLSHESEIPLTLIGSFMARSGSDQLVHVLDEKGIQQVFQKMGYEHQI